MVNSCRWAVLQFNNYSMKKELKAYYTAVEDLTKLFAKKYFKGVYEYNVNDWVDIGGVIRINDYYFDFRDIKLALEYKATENELFDYYDYSYKKHLAGKTCVSFEDYLKYFRGFSFKEIEKIIKR